jgi:hypothetical protein
MTYRFSFPILKLSERANLSERSLSEKARISRACLRQLRGDESNITIESVCRVAEFFGREVEVLVAPARTASEFSVVATSYKILRDGFESWRIHLMDLVDEFNRAYDPRLLLLPPPDGFDKRLYALFASVTRFMCELAGMTPPSWSTARYYLERPWFVSGMESLKASALLESPTAFRNNNIFVLRNFIDRA